MAQRSTKRGKLHLGTSGWNYKDWRGRFYPEKLRQADWLGYYAGEFETVEINSSFYRIPKPEYVDNWAATVPRGFRFGFKLWRMVTHMKKLKNAREALDQFFESVGRMPTRHRGPLLVQLPPNQKKDLAKLDAFFKDLKAATGRSRWKVTVEFRSNDWLEDPQTHKLLDKHRAALCLHDMPGKAPTEEPNDASFVYVRRHGPKGDYAGRYPESRIERDAELIRGWLDEGRDVFVYFNNDVEAAGIEDARQLRERVEGAAVA